MGELEKTMKALNKKFGTNYIGVCSQILDVDYKRHSTGVFALDIGSGGGLPERKIMMVVGKESSGKTTTMLLAIAECQRNGGKAVLIDIEHGFDAIRAQQLGVDTKKLIIAQSKTVEEAADTIESLIMTGEVDLICVDSVAAAPSNKELDESSEQKSMGGTAKAIGLMMRKIGARLNDVNNPVKTRVILLNQIRDNIGGYGPPEYVPGGRQLHFQCDIIVWLRPESEPVGGKDTPMGIKVKFMFKKNRTAPPFKTGSFNIMFADGVDNTRSIVDYAVTLGIVKKAGPWFSFGDFKTSGLDTFMDEITQENLDKIKQEVIKRKDETPVAELEANPENDGLNIVVSAAE